MPQIVTASFRGTVFIRHFQSFAATARHGAKAVTANVPGQVPPTLTLPLIRLLLRLSHAGKALSMRPCLTVALGLIATSGLPQLARAQGVDLDAVEARIAELERRYALVLSDIACDAPTRPAHQILCASAENQPTLIWRMGRLDDLAWVYAVENATGQQVDLANPPRDAEFIARRDACEDEACLAAVLIEHTNSSLGGTSPYPQQP